MCRLGEDMAVRPLTEADIKWLEQYRNEVATRFETFFDGSLDRFDGGERLLRRLDEALESVRQGGSFRAVDAAHNELCIARALLLGTEPQFSKIRYEPPLTGSAKSIDFQTPETGVNEPVNVRCDKCILRQLGGDFQGRGPIN